MPLLPGQKFNGSARVDAPPDEVWARLNDPKTWEGIPGVDRVYDPQQDEEGHLTGFKFDSKAMGRTYVGTASAARREEFVSLAWEISTSDIGGVITVQTDRIDGETLVNVALEVSPVSMMASLAFPLIANAIEAGFQESVDRWAGQLVN